ncbi:MAG: selenide, water dikinase SelD [Gammaproteobacteria bacterium]|nr:selenide, water dikinase SelD [Gammaproteobacteria bacterium]MBP6050412.1 selenide, water dikinase SelD [Pseudomonadales bacterium]MBK6583669.1 selenide, water dikinase SelD [Gammaproteobacteria bacterium]MBK7522008.1 selenide, water dikinase SelD [Gammaproteobacteria bacterium]MBK7727518.1 selenide, water dikinase SelD [Gammaproteobacteria bacterium]
MSGIKLTDYAHGGGCGCKISPQLLGEILRNTPRAGPFAALLVGTETSDDAAVYKLNDEQALIATTDFFMPIVDDPYDFGRIAATNAISDVYAMGGTPILALALLGMPIDKLSPQVIGRILDGGADVCAAAGIPVAGGHSIDTPEPIYGLVALGLVHPDHIKRNCGARARDVLILGKGLGVGVLAAALKNKLLGPDGYRVLLDSTTTLNTPGSALARLPGVHALTDVTGFGLLGHLLEICRGSGLAARIEMARVPLLAGAEDFARQGIGPGAIGRNWASYGADVGLREGVAAWQRELLCDAQTSGGLLVACDAGVKQEVLGIFRAQGFAQAAEIGVLSAGAPRVEVC